MKFCPHASNTWPLMYGRLVPKGLLTAMEPWWINLLESPPAVHYVHRWFAFVVLIVAFLLYRLVKNRQLPQLVQKSTLWLIVLVIVQISFGISVIWFQVPLVLALTHQAIAISLLLTMIFMVHRLHYV